jgi:hypothetical protein
MEAAVQGSFRNTGSSRLWVDDDLAPGSAFYERTYPEFYEIV